MDAQASSLSQETCRGYKLQFLRRTEILRPAPGSFRDNSRPCLLTRRRFISGCVAGILLASRRSELLALEKPKRIVSTAPSITETLFALGLGDQVVGVSRYCNFPASVQKLPKVGSYLSPDTEAIARLAPDLVVLERFSRQVADRLNALQIRSIEVPQSTLNDVYTGINLIGAAAGVPERATALNVQIQNGLAAVQARSRKVAGTRVLIVLDRRPGMLADLIAVGPNNYLQQLLEIAGGINVLAKPGLPPYPRIALETVLREDPEVILDLSAHSDSEAERLTASTKVIALWGEQSQIKAVRKGRVSVGFSNILVVPGPRAPEAASLLFDYMHGAGKGFAG